MNPHASFSEYVFLPLAESIESPNKELLDSLRQDANDPTLLEFQKDFLFHDMYDTREGRIGFVIEPEEAFCSIASTSIDAKQRIDELRRIYMKKKNEFFVSIWEEMILPNMDADAFDNFIRKMEKMDLGPDFVRCLSNQVESYKAHLDEVQEIQAQREAGELDEGQ